MSIGVVPDSANEANEEQFFVNLSNPRNGVLKVDQGVGTILDDDDPEAVFAIEQRMVEREGNAGTTTPIELLVTLIGNPGHSVSVDYATANGTATGGTDYVDQSGTLTFSAGEVQKQITIEVTGDDDVELLVIPQAEGEQFNLQLAGIGNGDVRAAINLVDGSDVRTSTFEGNLLNSSLEVALDLSRPIPADQNPVIAEVGNQPMGTELISETGNDWAGNSALAFSTAAAQAIGQLQTQSLDAENISQLALTNQFQSFVRMVERASTRSWGLVRGLVDSVDSDLVDLLVPGDWFGTGDEQEENKAAEPTDNSTIDHFWLELDKLFRDEAPEFFEFWESFDRSDSGTQPPAKAPAPKSQHQQGQAAKQTPTGTSSAVIKKTAQETSPPPPAQAETPSSDTTPPPE